MNNRRNLLECSLALFAAHGYDGVGVQEIVEAAGIQKPTLYHYFGSKRGLLSALLTENFDPFFEQLQAAAQFRRDIISTLGAVVEAYFTFAQQNPLFYRFYLSLLFSPPESEYHKASQALAERQQQLMEILFSRAAMDYGNMRGRHTMYAATFLGMVNTYVNLALHGYAELDQTLVYSLVHQYLHGIL